VEVAVPVTEVVTVAGGKALQSLAVTVTTETETEGPSEYIVRFVTVGNWKSE
jgi:hypothetical protein